MPGLDACSPALNARSWALNEPEQPTWSGWALPPAELGRGTACLVLALTGMPERTGPASHGRSRLPAWLLAAALVASSRAARASCNAIPSIGHTFPSELGMVSTPFAHPGQEVTVRRDGFVFAHEPTQNLVSIRFGTGGATVTDVVTRPPGDDSPLCTPADCIGERCRCLRLVFPDTRALVDRPADGRTLTGPATITVFTDGERTAAIGSLLVPGTTGADAVFPQFVALPPANAFAQLADGSASELRAAADDAGHLFVPLDFTGVRPTSMPPDHVVPLVQFVEAHVPGLPPGVRLDAFASNGRRLPPLVQGLGDGHVFGTADGPESVIRIDRAGLAGAPETGNGPIVIGGVTAAADPRKRADSGGMVVGSRFAVYEDAECSPLVDVKDCRDVDGDGELDGHFLYALDYTVPGAAPVQIDAYHLHAAPAPAFTSPDLGVAGYPATFPPYSLYHVLASDEVVAFSIPETTFFDLNGDRAPGELLQKGAYDLRAGVPVPLAERSVRQELDGTILAFSVPDAEGRGDVLYVYDAAHPEVPPAPVHDAAHPRFFVTRFDVGDRLFGFAEFGPRIQAPHDFAVHGGRVAFVVDEAAEGEDLDGNGDARDPALMLLDTATGEVTNLHQTAAAGRLRLSDRWLVFETRVSRGRAGVRRLGGSPSTIDSAVAVIDVSRPGDPPRVICETPASAFLTAGLSDAIVPCVTVAGADGATTPDANAFPRLFAPGVLYGLHVLLPDAPGGPREQDLHLGLSSPWDVQVAGRTLAVGVSEGVRGRDLDGNCRVASESPFPFGSFVVQLFNARTLAVTNTQENVLASRYPLLALGEHALTIVSPAYPLSDAGPIGTTFFDTDGSGDFELRPRACADMCGAAELACELRNFQQDQLCGPDETVEGRLARALRRRAAKALAALQHGRRISGVRRQLAGIRRRIRRAARRPRLGRTCAVALEALTKRCLTIAGELRR